MLETEPNIIRDFVDSGQVKLVFSPILDHGPSLQATEAAYCAGEQGRFWEMHDYLFQNQAALFQGGLETTLQGYAADIGLDLPAFEECVASDRHAATIEAQHRQAREGGIRIRPSFRLGERRIEGALPYAQFQALLQEAVASTGQ